MNRTNFDEETLDLLNDVSEMIGERVNNMINATNDHARAIEMAITTISHVFATFAVQNPFYDPSTLMFNFMNQVQGFAIREQENLVKDGEACRHTASNTDEIQACTNGIRKLLSAFHKAVHGNPLIETCEVPPSVEASTLN